MSNGNLALTVILSRHLCPCAERTASRATGRLAVGAALFAIRYTVEGRYVLRVECPYCGKAIEEDFNNALRLDMIGPPPGPDVLAMAPTQLPGRA